MIPLETMETNPHVKEKILEIFAGKGLCGLVNDCNFCYMNTAIQCLSNTLPLTFYFLNHNYLGDLDPSKDTFEIVNNWYKLIEGLWDSNCTIAPVSFVKSVRFLSYKTNNIFHNNEQHDVSEFIIFIIDNMHEFLAKKVTPDFSKLKNKTKIDKILNNSQRMWYASLNNKNSIIVESFYGQFISIVDIIESNKKETSFSYDPFFTIELEMSDKNSNIYDCLDMMTDYEILDGDNKFYSDKYKEFLDAKKKILILRCPKILIINLKRFTFNNNNFLNRKKSNLISFPVDNLDITKYTYLKKKEDCQYKLYAIANHSGTSSFGHYTSYCKNLDDKWYEYDDNNVREIDSKNIITNNAYCLFYQKK